MPDMPKPQTESGREWQRAQAFARKLDETGDTPTSFLVKGAIGCAGLAAIIVLGILGLGMFGRLLWTWISN